MDPESVTMKALSHLEADLDFNLDNEQDELNLIRFTMLFDDDFDIALDEETDRILSETEAQANEQSKKPSSSLSSPMARLCVTQYNSSANIIENEDIMDDYVPVDYKSADEMSQNNNCSTSTDIQMIEEQEPAIHEDDNTELNRSLNGDYFKIQKPIFNQNNLLISINHYEQNKKKAKNPVYTHRRHSVLVDQGFLLYELEVPNNPEFYSEQRQTHLLVDILFQ